MPKTENKNKNENETPVRKSKKLNRTQIDNRKNQNLVS